MFIQSAKKYVYYSSIHYIYTHSHSIYNTVSSIVDPAVGTGLYQYFVKVIPVVYTDHRGRAKVSSGTYLIYLSIYMCVYMYFRCIRSITFIYIYNNNILLTCTYRNHTTAYIFIYVHV